LPAEAAVVVQGLGGLQRAFEAAGKEFSKEIRQDLIDVAEPVRVEAERLAVAGISHIGVPWSRMRAVARRNLVYVAPVERGRASRRNLRIRRPNLADLLMDRAMQPALEAKTGEVVERFDLFLEHLGENWERA